MNAPLVSIVIPTYNQKPEYFRESLKGAVTQTYEHIEIIVSDNHSTNDCMIVLNDFPKDRIRIVRPEVHLGLSDHFIFAASQAKGEFISFLSSDDLIYPACIEKLIRPLLTNPSLSFSYCENALIDPEGKKTGLIRKLELPSGSYTPAETAQRMYRNSEYWVIGGLMRTQFFQKENFVRDVIAGDWVLGFKMLKYGGAAYVNEELSAIRFHEREGNAAAEYSVRHLDHHRQRVQKHNYLIDDAEFLSKTKISREQAIEFRTQEIMTAVMDLVVAYHRGKCDDEYILSVFTVYGTVMGSSRFRFLTKYYRSTAALLYIYSIRAFRKVKRSIFT
ncbi:MAG: glycosyltransferase family 2 protein [Bacteroidia bacterium]